MGAKPGMKNKRGWCVLPRSVLAESPGDRKAGQIQKLYTPALSPPGHISWKNSPEKNSSPPQPCREDALGAALGVRLWEVAIMSPGTCHAVLTSTGGPHHPTQVTPTPTCTSMAHPTQTMPPPSGGPPCALLGLSARDGGERAGWVEGVGCEDQGTCSQSRERGCQEVKAGFCAVGCVTGPQPQRTLSPTTCHEG